MNKYTLLKQYGYYVCHSNLSPHEVVAALHLRSNLASLSQTLNPKEKIELSRYDKLLLHCAENMYQKGKQLYNFSNYNHVTLEWWWHLDRIVEGSLFVENL
ncbi:hypothetical protein ACFDTO_25475 [Microbacteriaceae bacterium 4G12]